MSPTSRPTLKPWQVWLVEAGLDRPSWARTEEITAVSTRRFARATPLGTASDSEVADLTEWLREMVAFS